MLGLDNERLATNGYLSPRELIAECQRQDKIQDLLNVVHNLRPNLQVLKENQFIPDDGRILVNRRNEIELFKALIDPTSLRRILLVEAEGGIGKSLLLREFDVICPADFIYIPFDLKISNVGLTRLWLKCGDTLGWSSFPAFTNKINAFSNTDVSPSLEPTSVRLRLAELLSNQAEESRRRKLSLLSEGFLSDLGKITNSVVITIDAYEYASAELGSWITDKFLPQIRYFPSLRIIISGRVVPVRSLDWDRFTIYLPLERMPVAHWIEYAKMVKANVSFETIQAFHHVFQGRSLEMATSLSSLAHQRYIQ